MLIEGGHPDSLIMTVKCEVTKSGDDWAVGMLLRSHVYLPKASHMPYSNSLPALFPTTKYSFSALLLIQHS